MRRRRSGNRRGVVRSGGEGKMGEAGEDEGNGGACTESSRVGAGVVLVAGVGRRSATRRDVESDDEDKVRGPSSTHSLCT